MKPVVLVSIILLGLVVSLFSIQSATSQTATVTATTTITQPPPGQCAEVSLPFSAQQGKEVAGAFGSDTSIDFYVLSKQDLDAIRNPACNLPPSSRPLYSEMNVVGFDNRYESLPFPANGTYYFVFVVTGATQLATGYATVELTFPQSTSLIETIRSASPSMTQNSTTTVAQVTTVVSATNPSTAAVLTPPASGTLEVTGLVLAIGLIASAMVFVKRRTRPGKNAVSTWSIGGKKTVPESETPGSTSGPENISLGVPELDALLGGGLPQGTATLLISPPYDERELLLRKIIENNLRNRSQVIYLSQSLNKMQDLSTRPAEGFYVFSPEADSIVPARENIRMIQDLENLDDLNRHFDYAFQGLPKNALGRLTVFDFLSDVLREHKTLTTTKWLEEFIAKRKGEGFTVLGVLDPRVSSDEEMYAVMHLFDGVMEVYEKGAGEDAHRYLIVTRMYGRKFAESEFVLDKDKLL
jgi:archaellum biogenesis ATPase FlaH